MVEFGRVPRCAICNEPGAMYVVFFGGVGGKADKEFEDEAQDFGNGEHIIVHKTCFEDRKDLVNRTIKRNSMFARVSQAWDRTEEHLERLER